MIKIEIRGNGIKRLRKAIDALSGPASQKAYAAALNDVGKVARNKATRSVAKQMGVKSSVIGKRGAVQTRAALPSRLAYFIEAADGYTRLKDFNPVETSKGVRSGPWGRRQMFKGAFIGGDKLGGHVFHHSGPPRVMTKGRYKGKVRDPIGHMYGPTLPKEIVKGKTKDVFESYVAQRLPKRVAHHVKRATRGAFD